MATGLPLTVCQIAGNDRAPHPISFYHLNCLYRHVNIASQDPLSTAEYDYELPRNLIAQQPAARRDDARLMVVDRKESAIVHAHFRDLGEHLDPGDCLVINETRVIAAKLIGYRTKTRGRWHGLYLEHDAETGIIRLMCKTRGRLEPGELITLQDRNGVEGQKLRLVTRLDNGCWAAVPDPEIETDQLLQRFGRIPLPHYIRDGNMVDKDVSDYQTVYARQGNSVAAPTAGLHFTHELLEQLQRAGIRICRVNLDVGTGTFKPIATDSIDDHAMHAEHGEVTAEAAELISETRAAGKRVVAVGTTSARLVETAALQSPMGSWKGATDLFIRPGHEFRAMTALITNFHLPRTTLLVLVSSFGGRELIRRAYREAVENRYRFFSYGDAMLVL